MKKFKVEADFKKVFPDYKLGVVICNQLNNPCQNEEQYRQLLDDSQKEALQFIRN